MTFPGLTYAPSVGLHPDREGGPIVWPPRLAVLHTSEGGELPTSARQLCHAMTLPGDRQTSTGGVYGSSYHVVFDFHVVRSVKTLASARFAAAGANSVSVHGVFPGRAGQTRDEWLADPAGMMITQAALWLLDLEQRCLVPARRLDEEQVAAGASGYCDHAAISHVYKRSTHWDVGPGFPWDVLAARIQWIAVAAGYWPPPDP